MRSTMWTGAYIEPFAFERSRGNGNYTFVLSHRELFDEYCSNPDFRKLLDSGRYVFADGHVCLNDERYVRAAANGLRLTVWANAHVDRCCLRFVSVYEPCGLSDYRFSCLNGDEEYNRHYIAFAEEDDALSAREKLEHMARVLDALPGVFPEALSFLMEQTGVTEEALEERSGISREHDLASAPEGTRQLQPGSGRSALRRAAAAAVALG